MQYPILAMDEQQLNQIRNCVLLEAVNYTAR